MASGSLAMVSWYLIDRACFSAISALQQITDDARRLALALDAGRHHLVVGGAHAVQLERAHQVEDLGPFHQPTLRKRS